MPPRAVRLLAPWIAALAILAATLAPTVSRLLFVAHGGFDVCSTDAAGKPAPGDPGHAVLDHCPFCALHADLALPPSPPALAARVAVAFRAVPLAFLSAPRLAGVWSTAQPRAPPAVA